MENQEIMTNNEVVEVADEVVKASSGKGFKVFGAVLAVAGLAFGGYKLLKNRKAKKEKAYGTYEAGYDDCEYEADETEND